MFMCKKTKKTKNGYPGKDIFCCLTDEWSLKLLLQQNMYFALHNPTKNFWSFSCPYLHCLEILNNDLKVNNLDLLPANMFQSGSKSFSFKKKQSQPVEQWSLFVSSH